MRGRIKKGIALVLSAVLSVATCVTTIPGLSATVYAAGTGKNIRLGAAALSDNANTSNAATVHYGSSSDTWRVIGYGGTGVASSSGTLTLIASGNMEHGAFASSSPYRNNYSGSNLQSMIGTLAGRLSTEEAAAVATRTLEGGSGNQGTTGTPPYDDNKISGYDVSDAVMWPLSVAEANAMNPDLRKADPANPNLPESCWWLRSPGSYGSQAAHVAANGDAINFGAAVAHDYGVRPAFNLNLQSIIFTSAAAGGKASGNPGADALREVAAYSGNEWKLTLLDDGSANAAGNGHANFNATRTDLGTVTAGNAITVSYENAKAGSNEYVSAILVSASNENLPLYYGRIANNSTSSTGTDIRIPSGLAGGNYKIKVFAEQYNGDNKTDLVSAFSTISVTVEAASSGPTTPPNPVPPTPQWDSVDYFAELKSAINYAAALGGNQTVIWNRDSVLNYDIMKLLSENPSITLAFSYTYEDMDYLVTIPGRLAKPDPEIPIYGPLYLYGMYGGAVTPHHEP